MRGANLIKRWQECHQRAQELSEHLAWADAIDAEKDSDIRRLQAENEQLRGLLGEFIIDVLAHHPTAYEQKLINRSRAALAGKEASKAGYQPGTGSIILSAPRVTP